MEVEKIPTYVSHSHRLGVYEIEAVAAQGYEISGFALPFGHVPHE